MRTSVQVVWGASNWATQVQGVTADFTIVRAWPVTSGVFITDSDVRGGAKVAILGQSVVDQLFGSTCPSK